MDLKCRLCSSVDYHLIKKERYKDGNDYQIVGCDNCGLIYIAETYASVSPDYIDLDEAKIDKDRLWSMGKHKERAFIQFRSLLEKYKLMKPNLSLIDIGCGTGGFLDYVVANMTTNIWGFDASYSQVKYAQTKYQSVGLAWTIDEYLKTRPTGKFNIATMWDVLEHIRNPIEFLTPVIEKLDKEGVIFVSVPAAKPMLIKNYIANLFNLPYSFSPHEHVVYYSPKTLKKLANDLGLEIIKVGAVEVYPRPLSLFEIIRRCYFQIASFNVNFAPQIYLLAMKR